jgi:hypothetical protein
MLAAVDFFLPEKARFFAFSPRKGRVKNVVKYNLRPKINDKRVEPAGLLMLAIAK